MKHDILNRLTGAVQFSAEITCDGDATPSIKLGLAIKVAIKNKADLREADLREADLREADLREADLRGAYLSGAHLSGADLSRANLREADLRRAYLSRADLREADLRRAYLSRADLREAYLRGAYLSGADLSEANLSGADLSRADLRSFKADLWMTLAQNRTEVPALIAALCEGRVDGSQYSGDCACLVGTLANAKAVNYLTLDHDCDNPAERWFMMIQEGDKPGDDTGGGFAAQKALDWALEFCALMGIDTPTQAEV